MSVLWFILHLGLVTLSNAEIQYWIQALQKRQQKGTENTLRQALYSLLIVVQAVQSCMLLFTT